MNKFISLLKAFVALPKKIRGNIVLKLFNSSKTEDPVITWENKVKERKIKTQEAKKIWEEKKKKETNIISQQYNFNKQSEESSIGEDLDEETLL